MCRPGLKRAFWGREGRRELGTGPRLDPGVCCGGRMSASAEEQVLGTARTSASGMVGKEAKRDV